MDDEASMRHILELMLSKMGYVVLTANDGLHALTILEEEPADLVITDLKMPNMDGMALLKTLKQPGKEMPVILATAFGTVESAGDAMKLGVFDYIIRPFELENIMERAAVLSRGSKVDMQHLPPDIFAESPPSLEPHPFDVQHSLALQPQVESLEQHLIEQALHEAGGNKAKAARILEISERSLWYKLKKYQVS